MKPRNCFIDEKGNIFKSIDLIHYSKYLPVFQFNIKNISLDTIIRWQLTNVRDYVHHYKSVSDANLKYPIILRSDGIIMDGWHRIMKALLENIDFLPAKQFKLDPDLNIINKELEKTKFRRMTSTTPFYEKKGSSQIFCNTCDNEVEIISTTKEKYKVWLLESTRHYDLVNAQCPNCNSIGTIEINSYVINKESDEEKYGHRGANY